MHDGSAPHCTPRNAVEFASVMVQRHACCPPPPASLRVFEDGHCPTYTTGQDLEVQWDSTSDFRSFTPATQTLDPQADRTILVIATTAGVEQAEIAVDGASGPHTITNAELVAALGAEVSFKLRAYAERGGFRGLTCNEVTVSKV